jgi:O-antigen/teichoic acid export membrane protein
MRPQALLVSKFSLEFLSKLLSIVSMIIVVRTMGVQGYGVLVFMATLASFLYPLLSLGLPSAMVRYFPPLRNTPTPYFVFWRILGLIFAINLGFSLFTYWSIPKFFQAQIAVPGHESLVVGIISFTVVLASLENSLLEFQRAVYLLRNYLIMQVSQATALFIVAIFQPILALSLWKFLIAYVVTRSLLFIVFFANMVLIPRKKLIAHSGVSQTRKGMRHESELGLRKLIRFGLPMSIAGLGNWLLGVSDRLVISRDLTVSQLGVYGAVSNFALIFPALTSGFFLLAYPRIIRAKQDSLQSMAEIMKRFHIAISFALIPALVLMMSFGPVILEILLGISDPDASIVLVLCLIASMIHQWNGLTSYLITTLEETRLNRNVWMAAGVLNLALNLLFVPKYQLVGAAVVNILTFLFLDGIFFVIAARRLGSLSFYSWKASTQAMAYSLLSVGLAKLIGSGITGLGLRVVSEVLLFLFLYSSLVLLRHRKELATLLESFADGPEEI